MQEFKPGDVIAERFEVERELGRGGMGVVLAVRHKMLGGRFAIKMLLPAALRVKEAVPRFLREARTATSLQSEHVARVVDVAALPDGMPFMVMEYLDGIDLERHLSTHKTLPVAETIDIVIEALDALAEAHALNIVHRDLKPANLFLSRQLDGSTKVKVLDFGISKVLGAEAQLEGLGIETQTTAMMGSAYWMSPEQFTSAKAVDRRADLWAMGVILYQCLTGHVPFDAENIFSMRDCILQSTPRRPRELRPDLPPKLEAAVLRCLAKSRDERFEDACALASAIAPFGSGKRQAELDRIGRLRNVGAGREPSASAITGDPAVSAFGPTLGPTVLPTSGPSPRGMLFGAGGLAVLALALGVGWKATSHPGEPRAAGLEAPAAFSAAPPSGQGAAAAAVSTVPAVPTVPAVSPVPSARVKVTASPPDAVLYQNEQPLGPSPQTVVVAPGEAVSVEARRQGYASKKIEVKGDQAEVSIKLDASKSPAVKRPDAKLPGGTLPSGPF